MKTCPQCGLHVRTNGLYCNSCGIYLEFSGYAQKGGNFLRNYSFKNIASVEYIAQTHLLPGSDIKEVYSDGKMIVVKSLDSVQAFSVEQIWGQAGADEIVPVWQVSYVDPIVVLMRPFIILVTNQGIKYIHIESGIEKTLVLNPEKNLSITNLNVGTPLSTEYMQDHLKRFCIFPFENKLLVLSLNRNNQFGTAYKISKSVLENLSRERQETDSILKKLKTLMDEEITGEEEFLNRVKQCIGIEQTVRYASYLLDYSVSENHMVLTLNSNEHIAGINGDGKNNIIIYYKNGDFSRIAVDNILKLKSTSALEINEKIPDFSEKDEKVLNLWMFNKANYATSIDIGGKTKLRSWKNEVVDFNLPVDHALRKLPQINENLPSQFYINLRNEFFSIQNDSILQIYLINADSYGIQISPDSTAWKHENILNLGNKYIALVPCTPEHTKSSGATHLLVSFEIQNYDQLYCTGLSQINIDIKSDMFPVLSIAGEFIIGAIDNHIVIFKPQRS